MLKKVGVIAITGPTAGGKSDLGMAMAKRLDGEIICMDSMQVYRRMDIGTAKPTAQDRAEAPHHMLDIVEPTQPYAVSDYANAAEAVIADVAARGKQPILVGGTGLYLKALMHGLSLGGAGCDERLRAELRTAAEQTGGKERLHARLAAIDPATAARLHPNDQRRVIRAIEVYEQTGVPMSLQSREGRERPFRVLPLALQWPRDVLNERLERRVHRMVSLGLPNEVRALLDSGVPEMAQSMQGIGYKELTPVVRGTGTLERAVWQIIVNTRRYAKRQVTWLRAEPRAVWVPADRQETLLHQAMTLAEAFLKDERGMDE